MRRKPSAAGGLAQHKGWISRAVPTRAEDDILLLKEMDCPRCGLISPGSAGRCDCGYAFVPNSPEQLPLVEQIEPSHVDAPPALAPHRYPAWILLTGLGILATLVIALKELPPYYRAATLVKRAETLAAHGDDKNATAVFRDALEITSSSKRVRLGLATSYFRSSDDEDHKKGLEALQGITLGKDEWENMSALMPAAYRSLFTDVKK